MKQNKYIFLVIFICCFLCNKYCAAQINMVYSIGCVGNTNAKEPVYSGAVAVDGRACFNLSNGVSTFDKGKDGLFTNGCIVIPSLVERNVIKLSLRVFPNPVVTTVTVKALDILQVSEAFLVAVYDMNGQLVKNTKTNYNELGTGLRLDLTDLKTGVYVLKVSSPSTSTEFKLIKVD